MEKLIEFTVSRWDNLLMIFFSLYGLRNLYYLFRRKEKLRMYSFMSAVTFWSIIVIPVLNQYLKDMKYNDIESDNLIFLITCLLGVKIIIAVIRIEINPVIDNFFSGKNLMGISIFSLLPIVVRYLEIGYLDSKIFRILFIPYIIYFGYLWFNLRKTRNDAK